MASSIHLLLFSIVFLFFSLSSHAAFKLPPPRGLHLPIRKDLQTLQYYTTIEMGSSRTYLDVVIDLGGQILWFNCDEYNSSSYRPIRCDSAKCKAYKGYGCIGCTMGPRRPGCTNNTCGSNAYNPFKNLLYGEGFGEDTMSTLSTDGQFVLFDFDTPRFPLSCSHAALLEGLANGTKGMVGLGRTNTSLHTKLSLAFKLPHKFALCIPSSSASGLGDIFIGGGPYFMPPVTQDLSKSLTTTPLIINPVSTAVIYTTGDPSVEYFIDVKSIRVGRKTVSLNTSLLSIDKNGVGGTKLSTVTPYTVLHTSIYKALVSAFVNAAATLKIKRVASVAPFGACFSSKSGPGVPIIDLVLQKESVKWRIYGANSMVRVKKDVLCLGFVDGGSSPTTSIVLGGHQLENYLLEFDLSSSKLGFSSSLLLKNTSCSHYRIF